MAGITACRSATGDAPAAKQTLGEFDVSKHDIPVQDIFSGGPPKDGIPALTNPKMLSADQATFLEDDDAVVGIQLSGRARAYPLRILNWHEIVNDEVSDRPVAVTYCPLTGSAVVFDRRVGERDLTFGVSGRLYNSNVLMFDRQTNSLWSQLAEAAVTGQKTGTHLRPLPSVVTTWAKWRTAHPHTLVLSTDTGHQRDYNRNPYARYELSQSLMFPVGKLDARLQPKDKVLGITVGNTARAYPLAKLKARRSPVRENVAGRPVVVTVRAKGEATATINGESADAVVVYWFAWSAFHPRTELWRDAAADEHANLHRGDVELSGVEGYFTSLAPVAIGSVGPDGLGSKGLYIVHGKVRNVSDHPVHHIRLRFELVDDSGKFVYFEEGVNRKAERLLDTRSFGGELDDASVSVPALAPGESDTFRMAFIPGDVPPFKSQRVIVIGAE